jgi:PST family polysaccharide transporter
MTLFRSDALKATEKQIIIGVILASPLICIILLFDREILALLFTKSFESAALPMMWLTWGIFVRLLAWPLGFWMIAKSRPMVVMTVEACAAALLAALQGYLTHMAGLPGAGIGFLLAYMAYAFALVILVRKTAGRWLSSRPVSFMLATATALASCQLISVMLDSFIAKVAMVIGLTLWSVFAYRNFSSNED